MMADDEDRSVYSTTTVRRSWATALNYFAFNFIKIHRKLRMSRAMGAGVTDQFWSVEDLVALGGAYARQRAERAD